MASGPTAKYWCMDCFFIDDVKSIVDDHRKTCEARWMRKVEYAKESATKDGEQGKAEKTKREIDEEKKKKDEEETRRLDEEKKKKEEEQRRKDVEEQKNEKTKIEMVKKKMAKKEKKIVKDERLHFCHFCSYVTDNDEEWAKHIPCATEKEIQTAAMSDLYLSDSD